MSENRKPSRGGIPRLKPQATALLSYGFRPFFLGAAAWACAAMVLWVGVLAGGWPFADAYGPIAWHAHEFLFGYISAAVTGFLLTAIPNWTGRLPLQGRPLLMLFLLWVAGRLAMLVSAEIGVVTAAIIDCVYLLTLVAVVLREIIVGRNWRNLRVVVLVGVLAFANILFQAETIYSGAPAYGLRLGCAAIVTLIMLIGGRITPSFTTNWLRRQGSDRLPAPIGRFDIISIAIAVVALVAWVVAPTWPGSAALLLLMTIAQTVRLFRWAGERTWREPILFVLHLGYAFVPLGAFILAASILWPRLMPPSGALHAWTTGAMGIMTLAVMTRATLGHTGRDTVSTPPTVVIYGAILLAALIRVAAPVLSGIYYQSLLAAAACWIIAFGAFLAVYGPMLVRAREGN
jgi:uncharacterized protein involved in response to NO